MIINRAEIADYVKNNTKDDDRILFKRDTIDVEVTIINKKNDIYKVSTDNGSTVTNLPLAHWFFDGCTDILVNDESIL